MRPGQWAAFLGAVLVILGATAFGFQRIRRGATAHAPPPQASTPGKPDAFFAFRALLEGMQLPQATNGPPHRGQVNLVVTHEAIYLEGERLAALALTTKDGRIQRVDDVFHALKARREQWKAAHPGQAFEGEVALWVDTRVNAVAVKSIFQTAAFAGYPSAGFVARCNCPREVAVIPAQARVPGPPPETPPPQRPFLAVLQRSAEQVELFWTADDPAATLTVKPTELPRALEQIWARAHAADGPSGDPSQLAVVYVEDALPFGSITPVLGALSVSKDRASANGARESFQAFKLTVAVANPGNTVELAGRKSSGATTVSGRLAPEVIQRVVRQNFGDYRRCYDSLLKKDRKASGRVPISFVISRSGDVSAARIAESVGMPELEDAGATPTPRLRNEQLEKCLVTAFKKLKFPPPEGGVVNVTYPIAFTPE
mgnify:CR=1 FL=1